MNRDIRFRRLGNPEPIGDIPGAVPNPAANRRILREDPLTRRRYDDWRCYRCGSWYRAGEDIGGSHVSPIGLTMPHCTACAETDDAVFG